MFGSIYYPDWYVGITVDAKKRLKEHFVEGDYIYSTANSKAVAADVEDYFLSKGCDGSRGGGSPDSKQVYVYLKKSGTKQ